MHFVKIALAIIGFVCICMGAYFTASAKTFLENNEDRIIEEIQAELMKKINCSILLRVVGAVIMFIAAFL